jgi:hypothetical protein
MLPILCASATGSAAGGPLPARTSRSRIARAAAGRESSRPSPGRRTHYWRSVEAGSSAIRLAPARRSWRDCLTRWFAAR